MSNIRKTLGDNIRRLRNSHGWTQAYLADRLEITPSFLTMIESGQRGMSLDLIEKISELFNVPVAALFIDVLTHKETENIGAYFRNVELDVLQKKLTSQISETIATLVEELKSH